MIRVLILFILALPLGISAQQVSWDNIIPPEGTEPELFQEKLVQLAWQNYPENQALQHYVNIAKQEVKLSGWSWADDAVATFNLNEGNLTDNVNEYLFFPRYNFSLSVSLGTFINTPRETKIAREELEIAELQVDQQKLMVRSMVLQLYHDYLMKLELLELKTKAIENSYSTYTLIGKNFQLGVATLSEYNEAGFIYNQGLIEKVESENDVRIAKLKLEEVIGVKLEDVVFGN